MLSISNINVYYGPVQAIYNISLEVKDGEVFALLGRNGAGKTTLLKSCVGLLPVRGGSIKFQDKEIANLETSIVCSFGVGFVFQERCVFPELSVIEHLKLAIQKSFNGKRSLDEALNETVALFPDLKERVKARAGTLSGGEAQMLKISMALVRRPKLLLLDEPSQGLSGINIRRLVSKLQLLKGAVTIFLSEQNIRVGLELGDNFAVIRDGSIVCQATRDDIRRGGDETVKRHILA